MFLRKRTLGKGLRRYEFDKKKIEDTVKYESQKILDCLKELKPFPEIKYQ